MLFTFCSIFLSRRLSNSSKVKIKGREKEQVTYVCEFLRDFTLFNQNDDKYFSV